MIIDKFIEFEKKKELFNIEINDFYYWHYMRKAVYDEILNKKMSIGKSHVSHSSKSYLFRFLLKLKQIPNWIKKNPTNFLRNKSILVFNHSRRVKNGDHFECVYTDSLLHSIESSYYVLEHPHLEEHFKPAATDNLRYLDFINFKVALRAGIIKTFKKNIIDRNELLKFLSILESVEKEFNVVLNKEALLDKLIISYLSYSPTKKYYNKILNKVKPDVIIEVVSYVRDRMIINELAKDKGIPVIELQHGTMGSNHIAYNFSEGTELKSFPDYIFAFGEFWKETTRLPLNMNNVKVTGWPYFEKKLIQNSNDSTQINKKTTLLFISQGTIGEVLSKFAVKIFNELNSDEFEVVYKLHPGEYQEWEQRYPWLTDTNIKVVDSNEKDMHFYFSQADIQVGVYSTALYEGLAYELPTFIYKAYGYEYMEDLISQNSAKLITSKVEFINDIKEKSRQSSIDREYFWRMNSLNNMKKEIEKIINYSRNEMQE